MHSYQKNKKQNGVEWGYITVPLNIYRLERRASGALSTTSDAAAKYCRKNLA